MLSIRLICVGRLREKHYIEACREYEKRLSGLCRLDIIEVPEEPERPDSLARESVRVLEAIPQGSHVVALCIEGRQLDSPALAQYISSRAAQGMSRLCLIIGGSHGLADSVKAQAQLKLSMSLMTFPHHLARVMVLEQVYRALAINSGSKYHK